MLCLLPPAPSLFAVSSGEVITVAEGQKRLTAYAAAGQSHTYLMDLSKQEVIDATMKGGIARFINHSCEPNCETQKWQVSGRYLC
jgi:SET domain-containing protein